MRAHLLGRGARDGVRDAELDREHHRPCAVSLVQLPAQSARPAGRRLLRDHGSWLAIQEEVPNADLSAHRPLAAVNAELRICWSIFKHDQISIVNTICSLKSYLARSRPVPIRTPRTRPAAAAECKAKEAKRGHEARPQVQGAVVKESPSV
jgi:hypothetical protein